MSGNGSSRTSGNSVEGNRGVLAPRPELYLRDLAALVDLLASIEHSREPFFSFGERLVLPRMNKHHMPQFLRDIFYDFTF